jgi:amino acid adenylation domain-containing protein
LPPCRRCRTRLLIDPGPGFADGPEAGVALRFDSPSGTLPEWFLADLGAALDGLLALFDILERPLASLEEVVRARSAERTSRFEHNPKPAFEGTTVLDLFDRQVRTRPEATALLCGPASLSYGELDGQASRLADVLRRSFGIRPGQTVAALCSRSHWAVVSLLGIMKAGAVHLPLNPQLPERELRRILAESGTKAVVTQSDRRDLWRHLGGLPRLVADEPLPDPAGPAHGAETPPAAPAPADAAYVIYTSGTTGVPKGVLLAHDGLANTVLDHIERFGVTPADRYLQFMALSFDGFLLDVFTTLCAGAALVIADDAMIRDPARLADAIDGYGATLSTITPSYLQLLDPERLSGLRVLVSAGEAIDAKLAGNLAGRVALYNGYGPTEATVNSTLHRIEPAALQGAVPIGRPGANKRILILDRHLERQPVGVVGEICIAGSGLALGYVGDPQLTREKFVTPPFPGCPRLYRTGDLGAWTEDGELLFKGRADSQAKVNGYRIDLREIEAALDSHPAVRSSHARIRELGPYRREIWAFYQPASPALLPDGALLRHLADTLPAYMRPHRLTEVAEWPLTPHGKTDGRKLMEMAEARPAPLGVRTPPSSAAQRTLCAIWGEALDRPGIGIDDDFFSLGGDSIRLIRTVHAARRHGIAIEARDILDHPTIRRLALHMERGQAPAETPPPGLPALPPLSAAEAAALPSGIEDAYPAALMQTYMIRAYAADESGDGIYLGCAEWRLEDPTLSEDALAEAIRRLCRTNRSLRTSFMRSPEGRDLLLVARDPLPEIRRSDLRGMSPDRLEDHFRDEIGHEAARRFDPYAPAPPIRFHLCRTGGTSCSLFVSFHHALLDGWSGVELRNALFDHYAAAKAGAPPPGPASGPDSYKEFVAIERSALGDTPARRFWTAELASEAARASLDAFRDNAPAPHATPGGAGRGRRATIEVGFPRPAAEAAVRYGAAHGTSLKALFLSAGLRALMEVTGSDGLAVAVVTNGRSPSLSEPFRSTGLFWNIVPFIGTAAEASSVRRVQEKLNGIEPFGHFPWMEIEEGIARRKLALPLFNFVNFHNAGTGAKRFAEGVVQSRFHFPLTLFVKFTGMAGDAAASLRLEFDRTVIDGATAGSIADLVRRNMIETVTGTP